MKNISMQVKVTSNKNGTKVIVTREAELDASNLSFQAITQFQKGVEKVNSLLKTAIKHDAFAEFEIVTYEYNVDSNGCYNNMKMGTYRRWYYIPISNIEVLQGVVSYVDAEYVYIDTIDGNGWVLEVTQDVAETVIIINEELILDDNVVVVFDNMGTDNIYDDEIIMIRVLKGK